MSSNAAASRYGQPRTDERFFLLASAVMVGVIIAGFTRLFLRGITTFDAPWPVHLHALAFMSWVAFFMIQVYLACTGRLHLHRRFGWIGAVLMPLLLVIGAATLFRMMRNAAVPPFWTYAYFLAMNMVALIAFAMLTVAAIHMRADTQWHRRLMFCGMTASQSAAAGQRASAAHELRFSSCHSSLPARGNGGRLATRATCSSGLDVGSWRLDHCRPDDGNRRAHAIRRIHGSAHHGRESWGARRSFRPALAAPT